MDRCFYSWCFVDACDELWSRKWIPWINFLSRHGQSFMGCCHIVYSFGNYHAVWKRWENISSCRSVIYHRIFESIPGWLTKFLSLKFFVTLSKLSMSAYMLNPLVIMVLTMSAENSLRLSFWAIPYISVGVYAISNILAFLYMLFIQYPLIHVASRIFF